MNSDRSSRPVRPSQTCDVCKLRHQKCDNSRPCCHYCALRDLECVYSRTPAHQVTSSSIRRRSGNPKSSFTESADGGPPWLNTFQGPGNTLGLKNTQGSRHSPWTGRRRPGRPTSVEEVPNTSFSAPSPASPFKASFQHFVAVLGKTLLDDDGAEFALSLAVSSGYTEEASTARQGVGAQTSALCPFNRNALPPKVKLQPLLDSFLEGPNKMIFVCEPLESQTQLNDLYHASKDINHASLSLILLQLSVGAQNLGVVPHQTCSIFYESGRKAMEIGIEETRMNWLWVVQAHLLDCLYSMKTKPNMCWIVLGSAIRIAQTYRIDDSYHKSSLFPKTEHSRWRQVWLGIVFLDAWLSATLGRLPQINQNTTRDPFQQNIYADVGMPTHLVQTSLARISVITGGILQDIYAATSASIYMYDRYFNELQKWLSALPPTLRFHTDQNGNDVRPAKSRDDRISTHNLELVYLGSMLLLTRPPLLDFTAMTGEQKSSLTKLDVRLYAQICVDTAHQISHLSSLMKSQGLLAKKSWAIIQFNFHAALVLVASLSQQESATRHSLTGVQLHTRRQTEHEALAACTGILAYCATEDQLAAQYWSIVKLFHSALLLAVADVELLQPETNPGSFPTMRPNLEPLGPSPQDCYDYCPTLAWGPNPPAVAATTTSTSASRSSISTRMLYRDIPNEVQVPTNDVFSSVQDWFVNPTSLDLNSVNRSISNNNNNNNNNNNININSGSSTWSTSSYDPDVFGSTSRSSQCAPLVAEYTLSDDCGT